MSRSRQDGGSEGANNNERCDVHDHSKEERKVGDELGKASKREKERESCLVHLICLAPYKYPEVPSAEDLKGAGAQRAGAASASALKRVVAQ